MALVFEALSTRKEVEWEWNSAEALEELLAQLAYELGEYEPLVERIMDPLDWSELRSRARLEGSSLDREVERVLLRALRLRVRTFTYRGELLELARKVPELAPELSALAEELPEEEPEWVRMVRDAVQTVRLLAQ